MNINPADSNILTEWLSEAYLLSRHQFSKQVPCPCLAASTRPAKRDCFGAVADNTVCDGSKWNYEIQGR